MSAKRKNQDGEETETSKSHSRKKVKIQEARQIAIQVPTHVADRTCFILVWIIIGPTPRKAAATISPYPSTWKPSQM